MREEMIWEEEERRRNLQRRRLEGKTYISTSRVKRTTFNIQIIFHNIVCFQVS
jgi:hypothetical protein